MSQQLAPEYGDVEALLQASAGALNYPKTPNIAMRVRIQLDDEARSRTIAGSFTDRLRQIMARPVLRAAIAVLLVVAVVVSSALVVPQSREALADFFGLSHVKIEIGPVLGPPPPVLSPASFAEPARLESAQDSVDFAIRLPVAQGARMTPDAVYIENRSPGAEVVIAVYEEEDFDLYQSANGFFGKGGIPSSDVLVETEVHGQEAIWIGFGGHVARSLDSQGRVLIETERTVERATLLWEEMGVTYRLETSLSLDEAIRIAESLR